MADNNTLLEKLEGLVARFEEVSTLITDPNVIADQSGNLPGIYNKIMTNNNKLHINTLKNRCI